MSNGGTNDVVSESHVGVRRGGACGSDGRAGVLEAIRAIEAVEARQVIELAIVHLAALRRTEAELERLQTLLDGMSRRRDDADAVAAYDLAFHLTLADAARNTVLAERLAALHGSVKEKIACSVSSVVAGDRVDALIDSHGQLVEAIARRDVDGATDVFSAMMNDLRIESGRCRPDTGEYVIRHEVPQIGMLDDSPIQKGDRP